MIEQVCAQVSYLGVQEHGREGIRYAAPSSINRICTLASLRLNHIEETLLESKEKTEEEQQFESHSDS